MAERMRAEYAFSKMKGRRNPYARLRKKAVTTRLAEKYTDGRIAEFLKQDRIDAKTASRARTLLGG